MADNDATLDAQTELKKRARRRLVGATALALLAVIVLPMVMDREPKPAPQDIQVRIPSQDAGTFTSRILPAKPASTPLPPVEPKGPAGEAKAESPPPARAEVPKAEAPRVEAKAAAKPLADHVAHLVVHGVLHLLGYDHQRAADASRMEAIEIDVLAQLGIADPYQPPRRRRARG